MKNLIEHLVYPSNGKVQLCHQIWRVYSETEAGIFQRDLLTPMSIHTCNYIVQRRKRSTGTFGEEQNDTTTMKNLSHE